MDLRQQQRTGRLLQHCEDGSTERRNSSKPHMMLMTSVAQNDKDFTFEGKAGTMYENDYSWVPGFIVGLMAVAAVGGLTVAVIRPNPIRRRALFAWLTLPITMSFGLGVLSALFVQNIEPSTSILLPLFLSAILMPPWLLAVTPAFGFSRYLQSRFAKRPVDPTPQ